MSASSNAACRDALWQKMVICAETLNDAVVLTQRRATISSALRIRALASDLAALANAAALLGKRSS